jgi:hypothetical protein
MTITGEASILYIAPGSSNPEDLLCIYNNSSSDCRFLRSLFEQAVMRQIYEACGGTSCTEENFVKFMAGPPFDQWGIQAWYQAGHPNGSPNIQPLLASNESNFEQFLDNAQRLMADHALTTGCGNHACSWGNPSVKPPPPIHYASYRDLRGAQYGVFDGRVYFVIGR